MAGQSAQTRTRFETPHFEGGIVRAANDALLGVGHLDASHRVLMAHHGHFTSDGRPRGLNIQVPHFDGVVRTTTSLKPYHYSVTY